MFKMSNPTRPICNVHKDPSVSEVLHGGRGGRANNIKKVMDDMCHLVAKPIDCRFTSLWLNLMTIFLEAHFVKWTNLFV
jgi:hypothetical protein